MHGGVFEEVKEVEKSIITRGDSDKELGLGISGIMDWMRSSGDFKSQSTQKKKSNLSLLLLVQTHHQLTARSMPKGQNTNARTQRHYARP
jgi:hypothetical protein